jgi:hypothetical protein
MQTENYLIRKASLEKLFNNLIGNGKTIYAPKAQEKRILFEKVQSFGELADDYIVATNSAKSVVFPRTEKVFSYKKTKENTEITDESDLHLLKLILRATVFYALAWSIPRLSVQLYPEGVLQYVVSDKATTQGLKPSLKSEPEAARQAFAADFDRAVLEIETFLTPAPEPTDTVIMPTIITGTNFISA